MIDLGLTRMQVPGGGDSKNSEQEAYFLGSEIWLKFTFLGEKIRIIIFLGRKFLKLFFWGHSRWQNLFLGTFWIPAGLLFCTQLI